MYVFWILITVAAGLMLGSFFNVVIWRVPRGESVVFPGSHCPSCSRPIRAWENIPVVSYLFLRGKCAGCGRAISWLYPAVESLTALFSLLLLHQLILPHAASAHSGWEHAWVRCCKAET